MEKGKRKSKENLPRKLEKSTPKAKKSTPEGGLGALGGDLESKNLSKAVLADFGQFWPGSDRPKSRPNRARWRQELPSWGQDDHLEAIWGAFLSIFGGLGSDLKKNGRSVKSNNTTTFWLHFKVLAGLFGGSWG